MKRAYFKRFTYCVITACLTCLGISCRDYPAFEKNDRIEILYEGPGTAYTLKEISSPSEIHIVEEWFNRRRFQWESSIGEPYILNIRLQFYKDSKYAGAVALGTQSMRWQEKADYRQKEFSEAELAEIYSILGLKEWQYIGRDGKPIKRE